MREENGKGEVIDILVGLVVVNISQCLCILGHQVVYLKSIQFLIANFISIKLEWKGGKERH